jgi:NMD protein affecting ribosome stability and mRNA decay
MSSGKGLIRSLNRKGTRSEKKPTGAGGTRRPQEPTICERCGAVFAHQTWRRGHKATHALLVRASWSVCPACEQTRAGEYFGRVLIRGAYAAANEAEIRRRIDNVVARAEFTQPQRKLVSVERGGEEIEVLTTSQKLAHRIVHELKKAFRGRASYAWSDKDGSLFAIWQRDDVPRVSPSRR